MILKHIFESMLNRAQFLDEQLNRFKYCNVSSKSQLDTSYLFTYS